MSLPDIANRFSIRSIPTLVLLQGGEVVERLVGLRSEHELAQVLGQVHEWRRKAIVC